VVIIEITKNIPTLSESATKIQSNPTPSQIQLPIFNSINWVEVRPNDNVKLVIVKETNMLIETIETPNLPKFRPNKKTVKQPKLGSKTIEKSNIGDNKLIKLNTPTYIY